MDLRPLRDLIRGINFDTLGIPATVTPLGGTSVVTQGIWVDSLIEDPPIGKDHNRRDPRRVMALRLDEVPDLPLGSLVVASEFQGETAHNWKVDSVERTARDHVRYVLVLEHT